MPGRIDDAYGISSIVAMHGDDPNLRFLLIHATDGEQGLIAEGRRSDERNSGRRASRRGPTSLGGSRAISPVAVRVRDAMRAHRSQWADMNPPGMSEEQLRKSVSRETQVIAWPRKRPSRVLRDIFEDL